MYSFGEQQGEAAGVSSRLVPAVSARTVYDCGTTPALSDGYDVAQILRCFIWQYLGSEKRKG